MPLVRRERPIIIFGCLCNRVLAQPQRPQPPSNVRLYAPAKCLSQQSASYRCPLVAKNVDVDAAKTRFDHGLSRGATFREEPGRRIRTDGRIGSDLAGSLVVRDKQGCLAKAACALQKLGAAKLPHVKPGHRFRQITCVKPTRAQKLGRADCVRRKRAPGAAQTHC